MAGHVQSLPLNPRMRLTDTNGVRLARGLDTQAVWRTTHRMLWVWNISARPNGEKRELRYLVDELVNPSGNGVVMQTVQQVTERLLGVGRDQWSVTDVSNLLLCSKEHVHALLRAKALKRSGREMPLQISRASLVDFFSTRLVNE